MARIKLLLDEDVWVGLADALREAGYDAISVNQIEDRRSLSDDQQMAFAASEGRAIFTHNIQDFAPLVEHYFEQGLPHSGVIVARQFDKGTLLRRTLALLASLTPEALANTIHFV